VRYQVEYKRQPVTYLKRLPRDLRDRIIGAIASLAEDPDAPGLDVKKLTGREGFRLRVGGYRVIFERHEDRLVIIVVTIRARGDVYKG
jgi:mRNA interferase RelE/StbE